MRIDELPRELGGVELTIADDGAGFPEDFLANAFDRFSQANPARTRNGRGSGLGLAIALIVVGVLGRGVRERIRREALSADVRVGASDDPAEHLRRADRYDEGGRGLAFSPAVPADGPSFGIAPAGTCTWNS